MGDVLLRYYQNIRRGCIFFANPTARVLIGTPSRLFIPGRIIKCACCIYEDVVAMPLLVFAHIVSEDEVADFREALSVLLVSSARQLCPRRILHGGVVQPSLAALLFCLTGKSCSALFTLLLKMELSLALVRFWCFLVYFIHSGTFLFRINYKKEIVLAKRSITESV